MYVDDTSLAAKNQNMDPMCKVLMKQVDLGQPTSFFDHVYLGCTQRECTVSKDILGNYRKMFESRISAGAKDKLLETRASGKPNADSSSWSCDMESHAKKCVEDFANWQKRQLNALMTTNSRKKK